MSLLTQRTAIVAAVKTALPAVIDCESHGGRFTPEDLKRIAQRTPAIRVGCLGIRSMESDGAGSFDVIVVWGIFVITADKPQLPRDAGALTLVAAIVQLVPDNIWNDTASGYPENSRADNLYSGQLESVGVALWAITWQQKITLGGTDAGALDDFITFNATYDLAPPDGQTDAQDSVTLEQ